jgi:phospholipid transport system substrate-binding protein
MTIRNLLSSLLLVSLAGTACGDELTAQQVVEQTVNHIAAEVNSRRQELTANKKELYSLIDKELLPQFDTDYAGRLVLGKSWRDATPEQRKRFVDTFYNFLLRSYATAILRFDRDKIHVLAARKPPEDGRTVVETEMHLPDGSLVPVNYAMHTTSGGWKAYDVRIEGVSYVQNYRNQFNAEVAAKGLDALIARLEKDTADIDAGRREPDKPVTVGQKP